MKTFNIKRYLIEEFEIEAESRKEAIRHLKLGNVQDPHSITIIKETIKEVKIK